MKNSMMKFVFTLVILTLGSMGVSAQKGTTTSSANAVTAGLNLYAAAELFKDSENLEKFEQTINDAETGINNLDLDEDDAIDFIRVTETVADQTHLIILQTALGENDFQDVATIAVEQEENGGGYNLQLQGDPSIYGDDYYVVPADNNFSGWKVLSWLYRPNYRPYVSPFGFKNRPRWWRAGRRPLAANVYSTRGGLFAGKNFTATRTVRVKTIAKVNYRPRTSALVKKTRVTRVNTTNPRNGNQTTTTVKQTNQREVKPRRRKN
jgi:hypothetical protein